MKFDVILDTRSVQKTISQEIVYQIKESPSTSSRGKAGNRVKRSYNNFM